MRINPKHGIYERPGKPESRKELSKIFVVFEGEKTEPIYFKEIQKRYRISNKLILTQASSSNPQRIYEEILAFQREKSVDLSYESLVNIYCELLGLNASDQKISPRKVAQTHANEHHKNWCDLVDEQEVYKLVQSMSRSLDVLERAQTIYKSMKKPRHYESELDEIYLVVDRDRGSFTERQYDAVREGCIQHNINLVVTNPCIELFLLLHHRPIELHELEAIYENKKDRPKGKTFAHRLLCGLDPTYSKKSYKADEYLTKYSTAKQNAELSGLPSDLELLKKAVGTNIFALCDRLFSLSEQ